MNETQMVKVCCKKTGRHFALEVKKFGAKWKVVNFIAISAEEAAVMQNDIDQEKFETAKSLLPCKKCGQRTIGGCSCMSQCGVKKNEYNFQCVYCSGLEIDRAPAVMTGNHREGETIKLSQGQEVKISNNGKPLRHILVGTGWDPVQQGKDMDIDSSVVVSGCSGEEVVYFGNRKHPSGCVIHHGDNLTGIDLGANADDESIDVYLYKVPDNRDKLVFILNIYDCKKRQQVFGDVKNMYIKLYDPDNNKLLIEYKVTDNLKTDTALIIGVARKAADGGWIFKALGQSSKAGGIDEMLPDCRKV